jgi:outer membrane usher protein FimD/PapC
MSAGIMNHGADVCTVTVAAGGTAETVTLGYSPRYVRAVNVNNLTSYEHWDGMTDGTSIDMANHDTTQMSVNAAGGITLTATGFTLGVDIADTTSDVIRYVAIR